MHPTSLESLLNFLCFRSGVLLTFLMILSFIDKAWSGPSLGYVPQVVCSLRTPSSQCSRSRPQYRLNSARAAIPRRQPELPGTLRMVGLEANAGGDGKSSGLFLVHILAYPDRDASDGEINKKKGSDASFFVCLRQNHHSIIPLGLIDSCRPCVLA